MSNAWITKLKKYQLDNKCSYKQAMIACSNKKKEKKEEIIEPIEDEFDLLTGGKLRIPHINIKKIGREIKKIPVLRVPLLQLIG
jgi:hypothetical protein